MGRSVRDVSFLAALIFLGLDFPEDTFALAELSRDALGLVFFTEWTSLRDFCPETLLCANALAINIL
jgi:hypothetical protein